MSPVADTKSRIHDAALDLFLEHGVRQTSMRKIAEAVGITAPALYRHYKNKAEIFIEIMMDCFREFTHYLAKGLKKRTPRTRLQAIGEQYAQFVIDHPREYRMMFLTEWGDELQPLHEEGQDETWQSYQFLVDRVAEMQQTGELTDALDSEHIAHAIWSVVHGQAALYLHMGETMGLSENAFRFAFHSAVRSLVRGYHPKVYQAD